MSIELTDDQSTAYSAVVDLITDKDKSILVIDGFAGTGKTTLVNTVADEWNTIVAISNGAIKDWKFTMTATTNKAADALSNATGKIAGTIHSLLGLRVLNTGYRKTKLVDSGNELEMNQVIVIDEASFIDDELLMVLLSKIKDRNIKLIFIGDPCQLKPVNSNTTPVFSSGFDTVYLTQVVRQSDNSPIKTLSLGLRELVKGQPMPSAGVNGVDILHLPRDEFAKAFIDDCIKLPGNSVRALAWTNKQAIAYNDMVSRAIKGHPDIAVGDVAVVNKRYKINRTVTLPTESTVGITGIGPWFVDDYGIKCREVLTSYNYTLIEAQSLSLVETAIRQAYDANNYMEAHELEERYADLRLMYASTVNKSQGSTYDVVYVDLDNIGACKDRDQVNRMVYVAVSRAKKKVVFTGDV